MMMLLLRLTDGLLGAEATAVERVIV